MEVEKRKIHVVGINSFEFEDLSPSTQVIIKEINNIAIPESYFDEIKNWFNKLGINKKNLYPCKSNLKLIEWIERNSCDVVLISRGDPLWFGIGRILIEHFSKNELFFYPAITCIQIAFSKLKRPWQETKWVSIHGRDTNELIKAFKSRTANLVIIPDPANNNIELIKKNLLEQHLENYYEFWLCENLGFKNEKITEIEITDDLPNDISNLYIVVLFKKELNLYKNNYPLFGINDSLFKTFNDKPNLLTKKEIRIQILSDLELPEEGIIWDVGAGSGSIGLEALRLRPKLTLFSIDKGFGSKELILENSRRLGVSPRKIFEMDINELIEFEINKSLLVPSRVIIGGCKSETKVLIIKKISKLMKKGDIFVLPIITLEVLHEIKSLFEELKLKTDIKLIHIEKGVTIAEGTRFEPNNPIFILKGKI